VVVDHLLALQAQILRLKGVPDQAQRVLGHSEHTAAPLAAAYAAAALDLGQSDQARKSLESLHWRNFSTQPLLRVERLLLESRLSAV